MENWEKKDNKVEGQERRSNTWGVGGPQSVNTGAELLSTKVRAFL